MHVTEHGGLFTPYGLHSPQRTGVCSGYHRLRSSRDSEWSANGDAECSFAGCIIYSALWNSDFDLSTEMTC